MATKIVTCVLRIRGRVQGVGFRWSLCERASALGLCGWVRNRQDGSVEALIRGTTQAVRALTEWSRRGPAAAQVLAVETQPADDAEPLAGFEQRPTL
jgi:acylphosphatase